MIQKKDVAASIRQRLLNYSKSSNQSFAEVLQYYTMERFLSRLSCSEYRDKFILKGAMLIRAWTPAKSRPTMDIDLLGRISNEHGYIKQVMAEILSIQENDGIRFHPHTLLTEVIKEDADYEGVRVTFRAELSKAEINMQIDIGFGDIVYPSTNRIEIDALLEFPKLNLSCYSPESVIAEKLEAMIKLDFINSRIKDFFDIWMLSRFFKFDPETLARAISKTLTQRQTLLPDMIPALSKEFSEEKQLQWKAFCKRTKLNYAPEDFYEVLEEIKRFLEPALKII